MGRRLLVAVLALLPGIAAAEALNYDYVYMSKNGTESDGSSNGNGAAGGFKSFGGHTHVFASLDDTAFYAGSNTDWAYDLRTLLFGAVGPYHVGKPNHSREPWG